MMTKKLPVKRPAIEFPFRPGDVPDWASYDVVSSDDRRVMADVIEVTATECTRLKRGADGKLLTEGGALVVETVSGSFEVVRR